jgi:hypothetical protein
MVSNKAVDLAAFWGSLPDWIVAIAAAVALWIARGQLAAMLKAERQGAAALQQQANVARAELMLQIDQIFEGPELAESRLAIRTLRNQCEAVAKRELPGRDRQTILARSAEIFSRQLTDLFLAYKQADQEPEHGQEDLTQVEHDSSGPRYAVYMRLPYWIETVGLLTKNELLQREDVLNLYDGVMCEAFVCFVNHVRDRQGDSPFGNSTFLENAIWLLQEAEQWRAGHLPARPTH